MTWGVFHGNDPSETRLHGTGIGDVGMIKHIKNKSAQKWALLFVLLLILLCYYGITTPESEDGAAAGIGLPAKSIGPLTPTE